MNSKDILSFLADKDSLVVKTDQAYEVYTSKFDSFYPLPCKQEGKLVARFCRQDYTLIENILLAGNNQKLADYLSHRYHVQYANYLMSKEALPRHDTCNLLAKLFSNNNIGFLTGKLTKVFNKVADKEIVTNNKRGKKL